MQADYSEVFTAIAHSTRRRILEDLASGEQSAGAIAAQFSSTGPTISRHLSVLKAAGLVHERREANRIIYSVNSERLALALDGLLVAVCPGRMIAAAPHRKSDVSHQAPRGEVLADSKAAKKARSEPKLKTKSKAKSGKHSPEPIVELEASTG